MQSVSGSGSLLGHPPAPDTVTKQGVVFLNGVPSFLMDHGCVPQYRLSHPDYGASLPVIPSGLSLFQGTYGNHLNGKARATGLRPLDTLLSKLPEYTRLLHGLADFRHYYDEYDLTEVMPATCALGLVMPSHSDLDEGAPLGRPRDPSLLDKKIVADVIAQWKRAFIPSEDVKLSLPVRTNLGWPFPFSGHMDVRPFVLSALAVSVAHAKKAGLSLSDVMARLAVPFGPPILIQGTRKQTTGKPMPLIHTTGMTWTKNIAPRVRSISMGGKLGIIWNREATKRLLKAAMRLPQHTQERAVIARKIDAWKKRGLTRIAVDVSKFDKAHGGAMLKFFADSMGVVTGDSRVPADFLAEVSMPMLFRYNNQVYQTNSDVAPQLPSGVSFTTVAGLFFGDIVSRTLLSMFGVTDPALQEQSYLNWGDDIVIAVPPVSEERSRAILEKASDRLQLGFDIEPALRYLGFLYASGAVQARTGYSIGRMVSKQFFPETPKVYPFAAIGYWARLEFIPDPRSFHKRFVSKYWTKELGEAVPYERRDYAMKTAMSAAVTADIADADALNFLVHGMDADDSASLLDGIVELDVVEAYLGGAFLDVTDPVRALRENASTAGVVLRSRMVDIESRGIDALPYLGQDLASQLSLRYAPGSVVF